MDTEGLSNNGLGKGRFYSALEGSINQAARKCGFPRFFNNHKEPHHKASRLPECLGRVSQKLNLRLCVIFFSPTVCSPPKCRSTSGSARTAFFLECVILLNSLSLIQAVLVKHLCLVFQPILSGTVMFFFRNKVRWWVISAIIFKRLERINYFFHQESFTQCLTNTFYPTFSEFLFRAYNARRRFLFSPLIPLPTAKESWMEGSISPPPVSAHDDRPGDGQQQQDQLAHAQQAGDGRCGPLSCGLSVLPCVTF